MYARIVHYQVMKEKLLSSIFMSYEGKPRKILTWQLNYRCERLYETKIVPTTFGAPHFSKQLLTGTVIRTCALCERVAHIKTSQSVAWNSHLLKPPINI
ncbi:hypothetical protein CDAR_269151 [Caerostris darwini]|uniref:Uncharacterized protein n=1 Tax=Caerostris darwini TaxID=1538125 RepID=A0AAV4NTI2_9ARAC|nr:hypothetical protein CDAR_269151 [Caerostris darwini]